MLGDKNPFAIEEMAFGAISGFVMGSSSSLAGTLEPFSRFKFGARYFTVGKIVRGAIALWAITGLAGLFGFIQGLGGGILGMFMGGGMFGGSSEMFGGQQYQKPFSVFGFILPAYIIVSLIHLAYIQMRKLKGEIWYGYSFGICWTEWFRENVPGLKGNKLFAKLLSDWNMMQYWEPFFFAVILGQFAFGTILHDTLTSSWLTAAGVGMFFRNRRIVKAQKDRIDDMIDAEIESRFFADAVAGKKSKQEMEGYSFPPVAAGMAESVIRQWDREQMAMYGDLHPMRKRAANNNSVVANDNTPTVADVVAETMQEPAAAV